MSSIHDPGLEFIGWNFQEMLHCNNIQSCCTSTKNPQANAICKRMHQLVGNSLRVLRQWNPPAGLNDAHALVDAALANAMYAMRATKPEFIAAVSAVKIIKYLCYVLQELEPMEPEQMQDNGSQAAMCMINEWHDEGILHV
jgi:hypothetical protein